MSCPKHIVLLEDPNLDHIIKGIIKKRRLFVGNLEDFIHEVRIRIFMYGLKEGVKLIDAIANHVVWAHKSYRTRPRIMQSHQLVENGNTTYDHKDFDLIDNLDEIEEAQRRVNSDEFTDREKAVFNSMLTGDRLSISSISRQLVWKTKKQIREKLNGSGT